MGNLTSWEIAELSAYVVDAILMIVSIYLIIMQCAQNHKMYIKKRRLSLYHWLNISFLFNMTAVTVMFFAMAHLNVALQIILANIGVFSCFFFFYLIMVKNWLIFYKYKWTYYTMEIKWSYIINSEKASTESDSNWFIRNNTQYGNLLYIYKAFGVIFFIFYIIGGFVTSFAIYHHFAINTVIIGTPICMLLFSVVGLFYVYIVKNTPFLKDTYKIHWECKVHSKILLLWAFCMTFTNVGYIIFHDIRAYLVFGVTMNISTFLMLFVSTVLLQKSLKNVNNTSNTLIVRQKSGSATEPNEGNIDAMLSTESSIHAFMVHLSKEYSMEILLSYIELNQFQSYLIENIKSELEQVSMDIIDVVTFPDNIPQSEIIYGEKELILVDTISGNHKDDPFLDNAKIKAHRLYKKYIKQGSEFEINISSTERLRLTNLLGDLDVLLSCNVQLKDLLLIFENCKQEMRVLQTFALARYKANESTAITPPV